MGESQQERGELGVFRAFVEASRLPVRAGSIEKRRPPEPDIRCEVEGIGPLAFEVTAALNPALERRIQVQQECRRALRQASTAFPSEVRSRLANATVRLEFDDRASLRQRRAALPQILNLLTLIPHGFEGEWPIPQGSGVVTWLEIERGHGGGPRFDVSSTVRHQNRILVRIEEKFAKSSNYQTDVSVELLVYYYGPMRWPEEWMPQIKAVLARETPRSKFRRVWLFNAGAKNVEFVHPASGLSRSPRSS